MFKHADIWSAVDSLARERGLTASALARRAGLDPTAFNKSKRTTREGKPRWPSTESIAKVLEATGASLAEFAGYIAGGAAAGVATLPLIVLAQAGDEGVFDGDGRPAGPGWDEIPLPCRDDPLAWAVEVSGDGLRPIYRDGDVIVVSPAAGLRRGDRVLVKIAGGNVTAGQLVRRSARRIELAGLDPARPPRILAAEEVAWMVRIVWASQ